MCGFSGLPKLRQLVRPSGSAPTQARLRRALEHGLDRARVRVAGHAPAVPVDRDGERARCRRRAPATSTAASADCGRRIVREPTIGSYCSNTKRFDAMFGEAISARSVSAAEVSSDSRAGGSG